jgi:hypothetical protein
MDSHLLKALRKLDDNKLLLIVNNPNDYRAVYYDTAFVVSVERGLSVQAKKDSEYYFTESEGEIISNQTIDYQSNQQQKVSFNYVSLPSGTVEQFAFEDLLIKNNIYYIKQRLAVPIYRYYFHEDDLQVANFFFNKVSQKKADVSLEKDLLAQNKVVIRFLRFGVLMIVLLLITLFVFATLNI